jgi:hypothetical protein
MAIPLRANNTNNQRGATPHPALRRTLTARLAAFLAGQRSAATALDACPTVTALTLVVGDLASAAASWSARLGGHGEPLEPAQVDEPGLAQQFDLGPCPLILFEPADDTAAGEFLRTHGEGLYGVGLRDDAPTQPEYRTLFARYPVLSLQPTLISQN